MTFLALNTILSHRKKIGNYSGIFLAPPTAALGKKGDFAGTPRAPARGLRPIGANLSERGRKKGGEKAYGKPLHGTVKKST
jgi:hypothetical protein